MFHACPGGDARRGFKSKEEFASRAQKTYQAPKPPCPRATGRRIIADNEGAIPAPLTRR